MRDCLRSVLHHDEHDGTAQVGAHLRQVAAPSPRQALQQVQERAQQQVQEREHQQVLAQEQVRAQQ